MEPIGFDVAGSLSMSSFLNRYGNITGDLTAVMCASVTLVGGFAPIHTKVTEDIGLETIRTEFLLACVPKTVKSQDFC